MIRLRETNRNVPYFVLPKYGTGVISSKIKHFQCHSLPNRFYPTHKFTMLHGTTSSTVADLQDVSNGHRSSTVCLLKNKIKSKYLPLKYCSGWNYDKTGSVGLFFFLINEFTLKVLCPIRNVCTDVLFKFKIITEYWFMFFLMLLVQNLLLYE